MLAAAAAVAVCAAGCSAPLGPGFTAEHRKLEVNFEPAPQPWVRVRATWLLKNTGNQPLTSLDVAIPREQPLGRGHVRAVLDGRDVAAAADAERAPAMDAVHVAFETPWERNEKHELAIEYELGKTAAFQGVTIETGAVILAGAAWYPQLRAPKGTFAKVDEEKPLELELSVPVEFRAHSGGDARGVRKDAGSMVYRFRMKQEDGDPFVVAGRFSEQRFRSEATSIVFWTLGAALTDDEFGQAGGRIAATVRAFESAFGALPGKKWPYWIVLVPGSLSLYVAGFPVASGPAFFRGAVIPVPISARRLSEFSYQMAAEGLAQSWFGSPARTPAGLMPTFRATLSDYAAKFVAAPAGEESERVKFVGGTIQVFDHFERASGAPKEKSLAAMTESEGGEERLLALVKGELFLVALGDRCGQDRLHRALRHLAGTLGRTAYGYAELRSAVEQECAVNLAPVFREWLTETGIPAEFRRRYETPGSLSTP